MYHNVDGIGDKRFNSRYISQADFRKELLYFKKRYSVVPLSEMFDSKGKHGKRLAITFDDGLANNYKYALPELDALSYSCIILCHVRADSRKIILWPDAVNILTHHHKGELNCLGHSFRPHPWNRWHSDENGELMSFLKTRTQDDRLQFIHELEKSLGIKPNESAMPIITHCSAMIK